MPGPCLITAIWCCPKPFSQWLHSFQRKLRSHWLKFLRRHVTEVRQDPGFLQAYENHDADFVITGGNLVQLFLTKDIEHCCLRTLLQCSFFVKYSWFWRLFKKCLSVKKKSWCWLMINSLAPGGFENIFQNVFFKLISWIDTLSNSCETVLRRMPQNPSDDKSTLVQVMAWCRQATSHYLSQCCPRSLSPYGVTRPQWVKPLRPGDAYFRQ